MATHARGTTTGAALMGLCVGLTGCGDGVAGSAPVETTSTAPAVVDGLVPPGYTGRFEVTGDVAEGNDAQVAVCLGAVALAGSSPGSPPSCNGPAVVGLDWESLPHQILEGGFRVGRATLTGTWDGEALTLTAPAVDATGTTPPPEPDPDYSSRCPAPEGGWTAPDPSRATDEDLNALSVRAREVEGFAGAWVDQSSAAFANDPLTVVMNIMTVGDVAVMDRELQEVWGGSLCVSPGVRSETELSAAQDGSADLEGFSWSAPNMFTGQVDVEVTVAQLAVQQDLDDRFGEGVVNLMGQLTPID